MITGQQFGNWVKKPLEVLQSLMSLDILNLQLRRLALILYPFYILPVMFLFMAYGVFLMVVAFILVVISHIVMNIQDKWQDDSRPQTG